MDLNAQHDKAVADISAAVKSLHARNEPFYIVDSASETGVGSSNNSGSGSGGGGVDVSKLDNILSIDPAAKMATVEPNVTMGELLGATLEHELRPAVVIEFPETRIGRAFSGSIAESSSFKHGYFSDSVSSIEMVLADGRIVNASLFENGDLLNGAAGSMNTLGVVTKLEMTLVPACKFVKATYNNFSSPSEMIDGIRRFVEDTEYEFIDGIIFSETHCVVITGELVDEIPRSFEPQNFSGSWDPWFYLQVQQRTERSMAGLSPIDYIPLTEYLFRYDRGGFWLGNEVFKRFGTNPSNRFTRWFLHRLSSGRKGLKEAQEATSTSTVIIQDVSLPFDTAADFIGKATKTLDIWPMWVCPVRGTPAPTFHPHATDAVGLAAPMLNIGIWGKPKTTLTKDQGLKGIVQVNKDLENWVTDLGGRKTLCTPTYYTSEQFWKLYDNGSYETLRRKYGATGLPTVYDRISAGEASGKGRSVTWPSRFTISNDMKFGQAQRSSSTR
jgi:FAD/FMN-containing dehydrogenase